MSKADVRHAIPGRIRLRTLDFKDDRRRADQIAAEIDLLPGVIAVNANPLTGSLVVTYDPSAAAEETIIAGIGSVLGGHVRFSRRASAVDVPPKILQQLAATVAKAAMEAAIKRAILAMG